MSIRRLFRFKSIHTSIALAFSVLIVCTTVMLSYNTYRLSAEAVTDISIDNTAELMQQVSTTIQTYIGNMESIALLAIGNQDLRRYLETDDPNSQEGEKLAGQAAGFLKAVVASRNDIASIVLVGRHGGVVSNRDDAVLKSFTELKEQDWWKQAMAAPDVNIISSSHVQNVFRNEYRWVVSISRQISMPDGRGNSGVLLVDLNFKVINDLCRKIYLGNRGYVFILDPQGDLVYHPQQQLIYSNLKTEDFQTILGSRDATIRTGSGNQDKIYTIRTTEFGWKIVGVTYPDELVDNKRAIQISFVLWGGLSLIVALGISILLSYRLTVPLKKLENRMKQVEKGDFDTRVPIDSVNEIGKLARTFNLMTGKIKQLMDQAVQEQENRRISELKALQAQIQPHFLYNTLDSIIWMAEMGKMKSVVEMTTALSKLLRASISKGEELVPIETELEHVRNYLKIQSIRYRNKFTYSIEVDPEILHCKILKIVLQPLVENAIYHGIRNMADTGHIRITGGRMDGDIVLKVIDDGQGMAPDMAAALPLGENTGNGRRGMGVSNVNNRIRLNFGDRYGLEFASDLDEGTTVILTIPEICEAENS